MKGKKNWRKIKNKFKLNKLILYVYLNSFYLFLSIIIQELRNFKICKNLRNFDYILFYFIFFTVKSNMKKLFSLVIFFLSNTFWVPNGAYIYAFAQRALKGKKEINTKHKGKTL